MGEKFNRLQFVTGLLVERQPDFSWLQFVTN